MADKVRDEVKAKKAFEERDLEASAAAHDAAALEHTEEHKKSGEHIKSVIFGGMDGIITTFAVVSGATGGGLGIDVILILGFSNIIADALSMGVGDALSTKAENEFIMKERDREKWELENLPESEKAEMCVRCPLLQRHGQAGPSVHHAHTRRDAALMTSEPSAGRVHT